MVRASVGSVRRAVAEQVGSKVKVRSNLGRHKYDVPNGIIQLHGCHYKGRTINSVLVEGELINGEIRFISSFFVSQEYIL